MILHFLEMGKVKGNERFVCLIFAESFSKQNKVKQSNLSAFT